MKSEIGDINRFAFGQRLCSQAGLVLSTHDSGRSVWDGGITKREAGGCVGLWLRQLKRHVRKIGHNKDTIN